MTPEPTQHAECVARLERFVWSQPCKCRYQGDGDWVVCGRCFALGCTDGPWSPKKREAHA